jgi:SET domain-containing protein
VKVRRSRIHRWGVFAAEAIPARREVIEYVGARARYSRVLKDHERSWRSGLQSEVYLLRLDARWVINGAIGGNGSELINHYCDPNLALRRVPGWIMLFSLRRVRAGEELTLDYQFHDEAEEIPCRCGSQSVEGRSTSNPKSCGVENINRR